MRKAPLAWARAALAVTAATALCTSLLTAPAAAAPGGDWTVAEVDGGHLITLTLDEALPVRDAAPELAVDGESLGPAIESADGTTLTLLTSDPRAADPESVQVAWNGEVESLVSPRSFGLLPKPGKKPQKADADPATPGRYAVEQTSYDLGDEAITLAGLGGRKGEIKATAYLPVGAKGERPLVVFLHGRHSACYDPATRRTNNSAWPCPAGYQPILSDTGYTGAADVLASHGYVVVSVAANGVNAQDAGYSEDRGALARGEVVMRHLDLLAEANKGRGDAQLVSLFKGRLDMDDIGLMGHSRGGEGVVKAALMNAGRKHPYGIEAVLPLAPTDFARATLPDVPMAVILPYCDGDVSNQQGQHFYDDSLYADADDTAFKSSLMIMGTNHNFFNTEWTPGVATAPANDDWSNQNDATCGTNASPDRLTAAEQYDVGTAYIAGFFRLVQGGEDEFLPLFDGSDEVPASAGRAVVHGVAQAPAGERTDVAAFTSAASSAEVSGNATGVICASMLDRSPQTGLPSCATRLTTSQAPSWTPATYAPNVAATPVMRFSWADTTGRLTASVGKKDRKAAKSEYLSFRVARDETVPAAAELDLSVSVVDGRGRTATVNVADLGDALTAFPGTASPLGKTWLRSVRIPVGDFKKVDTKDIRSIVLAGASATGAVYLADLGFTDMSVGRATLDELPQVSVEGATVVEGDGPGTATLTVSLSERSRVPVTVNLQSLATGTTPVITQNTAVVTIPAGRTSGTFTVPLVGNDTVSTAAQSYQVIATVPANAAIGSGFARLVVTEDD
ncbi:hypothetical protein GCM10022221_32300 [Actinocorallia aurea]